MIRRATPGDIDEIIKLGSRLVASGAYAHTIVSYKACVDHLSDAMRSPGKWVGVAVHKGKVVGFLILVVQRYWWSAGERYVMDDGIFCTRAGLGRKLVNAGCQWAAKIGAKEVMIALTSQFNTDRSVRAMRRSGFVERGVVIALEPGSEVKRWAA